MKDDSKGDGIFFNIMEILYKTNFKRGKTLNIYFFSIKDGFIFFCLNIQYSEHIKGRLRLRVLVSDKRGMSPKIEVSLKVPRYGAPKLRYPEMVPQM